MVLTLLITTVIEGVVVVVYSLWYRKPLLAILLTSCIGNVITQSFLWFVLTLFFRHYMGVLIAAEIVIWLIEGILLHWIPATRLNFANAILLSLLMNLASFSLGWLLPV